MKRCCLLVGVFVLLSGCLEFKKVTDTDEPVARSCTEALSLDDGGLCESFSNCGEVRINPCQTAFIECINNTLLKSTTTFCSNPGSLVTDCEGISIRSAGLGCVGDLVCHLPMVCEGDCCTQQSLSCEAMPGRLTTNILLLEGDARACNLFCDGYPFPFQPENLCDPEDANACADGLRCEKVPSQNCLDLDLCPNECEESMPCNVDGREGNPGVCVRSNRPTLKNGCPCEGPRGLECVRRCVQGVCGALAECGRLPGVEQDVCLPLTCASGAFECKGWLRCDPNSPDANRVTGCAPTPCQNTSDCLCGVCSDGFCAPSPSYCE